MPTSSSPSRRQVLGAAGAAAAGWIVSDSPGASATAGPRAETPRLPLNILLRGGLSAERVQRIRQISPQITIERELDLATADVVFGGFGAEELPRATRLRWVQYPSAGVEHLLTSAFVESDMLLTNAQGCYGPEIAEHAFGLLFALTRGIGQQARQMGERKWGGPPVKPIELRGMTMGIIGLGGIGREVARRAKAMDMKTLAVDAEPMLAERFAMVDEVRLVDDGLDELLQRSDVLVCCAPHTPKSRGMLGAEQFARAKRGAWLINVSRGKLVKTEALLEALQSGQIAGAGLDVTDPEPLPADHPLWEQPNVVITAHIAGQSQFSWERVQNVFAENVARYVGGLPLLNVVDKRKGY
jgi:phosphoglycerate dehydrogenase-like enzyme